MALNIPMPNINEWGDLTKGVNSGTNLFNSLINPVMQQAQIQNNLTGIAKEVQSLDKLKNMLPGGEENPIYQQAKQAFDLDQQRIQQNINASKFYTDNPWRLYDPTTKQFHAQQMAAQGKYPEGGYGYSPEQAQQIVNTYEKERYNKGTPTFLQQQKEAGEQIDETIKLIDPKKAFGYSGVVGQTELWKDRYEAQKNGKISQKLKDFEEQETYLHNLREQIRSYLGASITAGMTKDLDYLVNPNNWMNHPEIAERKYNAVIKAYENEKKVTDRAVKHGNPSAPKPIFDIEKASPNSHNLEMIPGESNAPLTQAVLINGVVYDIPIGQVEQYISTHPGAELYNEPK